MMSKKQIFFVTILTVCVFCKAGYALMPPHVTGSSPENGGTLSGNALEIYGYTLSFADLSRLQVLDVTGNKSTETSTDLFCEAEYGRDDPDCEMMPGCVQEYCILYVTLHEFVPDHQYEISFLETTISFNVPSHPYRKQKRKRKRNSHRIAVRYQLWHRL